MKSIQLWTVLFVAFLLTPNVFAGMSGVRKMSKDFNSHASGTQSSSAYSNSKATDSNNTSNSYNYQDNYSSPNTDYTVGSGSGSFSRTTNPDTSIHGQGSYARTKNITDGVNDQGNLNKQNFAPTSKWEVPKNVSNKFPQSWVSKPNKKGVGTRWQDPNNPGNGVRIDKGNPNHPLSNQQVDHVIVRKNGQIIGRDGKPIQGSIKQNATQAHITLKEYQGWRNWSSP